jgi:tetratricopeptide (TPR) repeat protein
MPSAGRNMFSSRNIHFAILGIILGASTGYIFAFYQVQSSIPRTLPSAQESNVPEGHPNVNNEELLTMFKAALAKNPNDTTLITRYANFLFDLGRFNEAVEWFRKAIAIQPENLDYRTDFGTALWNAGQKDQAMAEYQQILKINPRHMATLHNIVIVDLEARKLTEADQVLKQMEAIDPKYEGLEPLRKRLAELK